MGLIDLKTDLKSLKYGKDKPGGGDSRQPFIKSPIPEGFYPKSGPDFLLRNGFLNPVSSIRDVLRISKFLTTVDGLLFVAKQEVLALTNPVTIGGRTSTNFRPVLYNPLNTLAQVGGNSIGFHTERTGPFPDITNFTQKYEYLQKNFYQGSNNRLQLLFESKIKGNRTSNFNEGKAKELGLNSNDRNVLFDYIGGPSPNAIQGGRTKILRVTYTDNETNPKTGNPRPVTINKISYSGIVNKYNLEYDSNNPVNPFIYKSGSLETDNAQLELKSNSKVFIGLVNYSKAVGASQTYYRITGIDPSSNTFNTEGSYLYSNNVYLSGSLSPNFFVINSSTPNYVAINYSKTLGASKKYTTYTGESVGIENTISTLGGLLISPNVYKPNTLEPDIENLNKKKGSPFQYLGGDEDKLKLSFLYRDLTNDLTFSTNEDLGLDGNNRATIKSDVYTEFPKTSEIIESNKTATWTQEQLINSIPVLRGSTALTSISDYRKKANENKPKQIQVASEDYENFNREKTYSEGNPGLRNAKRVSYTKGPQDVIDDSEITSGRDKINLYSSTDVSNEIGVGDIIKFNFRIINNNSLNDEFIYFRAYIDEFSDVYTSNWNSYQYVGRAEKFYRYSDFERKITVGFTVAAQSRAELLPIYRKINNLIGAIAPDYSQAGFLRGSVVKITIGDYITSEPGIINGGLTISPILDAGWEIARSEGGKLITDSNDIQQLPLAFKVSGLSINLIHKFIPRKGQSFIGNSL
jgi:hypothetical protein